MPTIYINPGRDEEPIDWSESQFGHFRKEIQVTEEQLAILNMLTEFAADLDTALWSLYDKGKWPER